MWKHSRQTTLIAAILIILILFGSKPSQVFSIRAVSKIVHSINQCNEHCGNVSIPYPFYIRSKLCGRDGFKLDCYKNSVLKIKLSSAEYFVLSFQSDGIIIDPLHSSCNQNLNKFSVKGVRNYAISVNNFLQLSDCNNASGCFLDCNIPVQNNHEQCKFEHTCCYPLMNNTTWQHGDDFSRFSALKCTSFTSWVVSNQSITLDAEYGLKLEWGVLGTCNDVHCAPNAYCEKTVAVKDGVRCTCKNDYAGDGFAEGGGCVKVCTRHGEKAYDKHCRSQPNVLMIVVIAAGILAAATIAAAILIAFALLRRRKSLSFRNSRGRGDGSQLASLLPMHAETFTTELFSYKTLEKATKGFAATQKCGHGACGTVYAGKLHDGRLVAVKRMHYGSSEGVQQLLNEISVLSTVTHKNLVQLLGCCLEADDPILVYEFVPNGTLAEHLQRERGEGLDWCTRISIATDASEALAYLHSTVSPPIYHRDVKSCNILLDFDFNCKVADFGLSRLALSEGSHISTVPQGTPGYLDPEYHQNFHLSDKSDVYSFGVVLIEIITAMKPVDFARDQKEVNLAALALAKITSGCLDDIIDPFLQVDQQPSVRALIQRVAELAFRCLSYDKDARPTMIEVAQELLSIKKASMPLSDCPQTNFSNLPEGTDSPDKLACSPTSVQALWPSTSTTPSDSLTYT
eukprot:Gb_00622 [translate_table: standard]